MNALSVDAEMAKRVTDRLQDENDYEIIQLHNGNRESRHNS
jgi:hypothetical protein